MATGNAIDRAEPRPLNPADILDIWASGVKRAARGYIPGIRGFTLNRLWFLADPLADRHRRRHRAVARLVAAHVLEQLHHVGGGEEVHADHALWT